MTRIYLVRHGQTAWNKEEIFRGRTDVPLNETGLREAQLAGEYFQEMDIHAVYSSPLLRAWETAQKIAEVQSLEVRPLQGIIDMCFGAWEGQSLKEVQEKDGERFQQWKNEPHLVRIPGGDFRFYTKRDPDSQEPFIALPDYSDTTILHLNTYYIDKYPVTNQEFKTFLTETRYIPYDTTNFLKHWIIGTIPSGEEDFPVVYVSGEDATAYAEWAKKRLPTEAEWQYAAQGNEMKKFPWGNTMDSTKCNYKLNHPTSVKAFPKGASLFGVEDMIGNVWQLTNDMYDIGSYHYAIIKGGSFYHPTSSIWYVTGGPLPADHPEMLLLIYPGLDRNSTVGFRCVKDGE